MPKFTDKEKEQIRKLLLLKGKDLFSQLGLAKTSIDDIVQATGIAKGSFYKFYDSKEALYFDILRNEEAVRGAALKELSRDDLPPKELLSSFFKKSFQLVDENPFLQRVFQGEDLERLMRKLPNEMDEFSKAHMKKGKDTIDTLIKRGIISKENPEIIVGIIQATLMMRLHKEEFEDEVFPLIMNKMFEYIAEGLTKDN
ncbi:TetR/AcrR family transcriptional regulator [Metabacillus niabensis]|uniref:AcrR family transcriptional regulator n=1 Tax=Metabacillus niabensis TaxID=324854 RepID=A0ABT9Z3J6_9BACI|nr:TetR/AcrR family transcriptional regulator [Metabacillus niabensis]MDQ0226831.1 AcrR family transcriptional regulator [Metabacillus niabensis]